MPAKQFPAFRKLHLRGKEALVPARYTRCPYSAGQSPVGAKKRKALKTERRGRRFPRRIAHNAGKTVSGVSQTAPQRKRGARTCALYALPVCGGQSPVGAKKRKALKTGAPGAASKPYRRKKAAGFCTPLSVFFIQDFFRAFRAPPKAPSGAFRRISCKTPGCLRLPRARGPYRR